jgi:hypothetical protein
MYSTYLHKFLGGVAYFLPQGLRESQFWLHSHTWQCCPRATVKPELHATFKNVKHAMPRGLILNEKGINKIGKEGRSVCHRSGCPW